MNFEEFKEQLVSDLKQKLEEQDMKCNIATHEVPKLNDSYEAITITPEGSNVGVNVNMNRFYDAMSDGMSYDAVVENATDIVKKGIEERPTVDLNALTNYDEMKKKLVMEVVSMEANKEMLETVPHKEMEDMAVVYRFVFDSTDDSRATILATNQLIDSMGVTPEQLHADAIENAPELKPAVIKGMSEVMAEMMGMSAEDLAQMGMPTNPADEQMFVATTPDKIHGAGIIAYQDFMDRAAERVGGDFFILPSSIHEILLVPDNGQVKLGELQDMVREVNATQVAPEEKLTDNVYHYDSKEKVFELGEKFVERQAEKDADLSEEKGEKSSIIGDLKEKKDEVAKAPKKEATVKATKSKGAEL